MKVQSRSIVARMSKGDGRAKGERESESTLDFHTKKDCDFTGARASGLSYRMKRFSFRR